VLARVDRDIDALVRRTAEASVAVRDAILALEDGALFVARRLMVDDAWPPSLRRAR